MAVEAPEAAPSLGDIFAKAATAGFGADAAQKSGVGTEQSSGAGEPAVKAPASDEPDKSVGDLEVEKQQKEPDAATEAQKEPQPKESEETAEGEPTQLDEKGRYRWGELKKENKNFRQEIATLKEQLKQNEEASTQLQELRAQREALEKQIQEANGELYLHRVEATSEWKKTVAEPFAELSRSVDDIARLTNVEGDKIMDAVVRAANGDREAITTLTEGWQDWEKQDLRDAVKNMVSINRRAGDLRKDSKQAYEASMRNQQELTERQQKELSAAMEKAATRVSESFKQKLDGLLPESDKLDYARISLDAQKGFGHLSPDEQAFAVYSANAVMGLHKLAESQRATIKAQEAELAKFRNGAPKASSQGTSPSSPAEAEKPKTRDELANTSWDSFAERLLSGTA